jgi:type IV pilus assembly protein PilO
VNFTTREKKLFMVLGIVLAMVAYFYLFLNPQLTAIKGIQDKIGDYSQSLSMNNVYKVRLKGLDSDVRILNQKLKDLRATYPPAINYDEVLITVRDIARKANLSLESMAFTEASPLSAQATVQGNEQALAKKDNGIKITDYRLIEAFKSLGIIGDMNTNVNNAPVEDGKAFSMDIKISGKGSSAEVKNFLYDIMDLKNKAAFKDLKISNDGKGLLTIDTTLIFFGIADKNAGEYTMLADGTWKPLKQAQNKDIFTPFKGLSMAAQENVQTAQGTGNTTTYPVNLDAYDFTMRVMPYGDNAAPPTVSVAGKSIVKDKNTLKSPIIYGDSKSSENVEIFVEEKEGKLFCKFKTDHEAFPEDSFGQETEFTPVGEVIKLLIDSTPRKFDGDKAGVNLTVINKTSKSFSIEVINEDGTDPRVRIAKQEGNVVVNYK